MTKRLSRKTKNSKGPPYLPTLFLEMGDLENPNFSGFVLRPERSPASTPTEDYRGPDYFMDPTTSRTPQLLQGKTGCLLESDTIRFLEWE